MIELNAQSKSYGNNGQYIARIKGRSAKYTYEREFVGRKNGSTSTALIDDPGVYEIADLDKKGRKDTGFRVVLNRPADCPPLSPTADAEYIMSGYIPESDVMVITKRMDAGESIADIVGFRLMADGQGYEHFIRTKAEARQASISITIDSAVEACWKVLGALPEREAKKVLAALKLRVSPPKPKTEEPEDTPVEAVEAVEAGDSQEL